MRFERIACTGGSGRLGRHVVERLAGRCELTVLDLVPPHREVAWRETSITDYPALIDALRGQDAVVHLAAVPNPRTASPEACFRTNAQGTWALLQAAEDAGVRRVVVASSDAALGLHYNPPGWGPQYLPIDEAHPLRPSEVYSLSKQVTEDICRCFAVRGRLEVLVIRPTHIVFPPEYPELRERGSDVHNYHLWTYVAPEDVAQGFERALALKDGRFDLFLVSAADGLNTRPTLELVEERFGRLPEVRKLAWFAANPTASILDISHAREVLGFEPALTWRDFAPA